MTCVTCPKTGKTLRYFSKRFNLGEDLLLRRLSRKVDVVCEVMHLTTYGPFFSDDIANFETNTYAVAVY